MKYQQPYGILDVNAGYINGDPSIGRAGSIPPAAAFEQPMREIVQCITGAGLTPTNDDLTQLYKALQICPWINEYAQDTGSANVYSCAVTPVPTQYYVGMRVYVKMANDNSGSSTLNVNGLGAHNITRAGGASLNAGDIKAGQVAGLVFDGTNFHLINFLGFTSDTTIVNNTLSVPFAVDTGAINAIIGIFNPIVTVLAAGNPFLVKVTNTNTGPTTLKANSVAAKPLVWPDGTQLAAGDIVNGGIIFVVFDGTSFQLLCRINGGGGPGGPTPPTTGVPGTLDLWPLETPPVGAYECNGQALNRTTDARLFSIIGTRYGAPDAASFNVPDMRGQFIRGWSHSSGVDPDAATRTNRGDGTAGDHVGTKQTDQNKAHQHDFGAGATIDFGNSRTGNPATAEYVIDPALAPPNNQINWGNAKAMAVEINGTPDTGGKGIATTNVSNVVLATKIDGLPVSGSLSSAGGAEVRPINVNMMIIIWR